MNVIMKPFLLCTSLLRHIILVKQACQQASMVQALSRSLASASLKKQERKEKLQISYGDYYQLRGEIGTAAESGTRNFLLAGRVWRLVGGWFPYYSACLSPACVAGVSGEGGVGSQAGRRVGRFR